MKSKVKKSQLLIEFIIMALLIALDQYTKYLAVIGLKGKAPLVIWEGIFELRYLENRGAAFGMLQNQKGFFICVAFIILLAICFSLFKIPGEKRYLWLRSLLVMIAAGAVGNMIDRIYMGYVVDFFYFILIDFPIFNVADIYVSVSCVVLAILLMFYYQEEELQFFQKKE